MLGSPARGAIIEAPMRQILARQMTNRRFTPHHSECDGLMEENISGRERLLRERRALRRRNAKSANAISVAKPDVVAIEAVTSAPAVEAGPPRFYRAHPADRIILLKPLDRWSGDRDVVYDGPQIPPLWRLRSAISHSGGYCLALQNEQDPRQFALWHIDNVGRRSLAPTFTAADLLALMRVANEAFSSQVGIPPAFDFAAFSARYAMYQALLSDRPTKAIVAQNLNVVVLDKRAEFEHPNATFDRCIKAVRSQMHIGLAVNADYAATMFAPDRSHSALSSHVLSFLPGVALVPEMLEDLLVLHLGKGRDMRLKAAYFPAYHLLVGDASEWRGKEGSLADLLARQIFGLYAFSEDISRYLSIEVNGIGLQSFEYHIGHYLWNELSAIDQVIEKPIGTLVQNIYVSDWQPEHFGAIDVLYPQFRERIVRRAEPRDWLIRTFRDGLVVFKPASRFIPSALSERIVELSLVEQAPLVAALNEKADALSKSSSRVLKLVIGLRVENRCWPGQVHGYVALAKAIASRGWSAVVVFDGHNIGGTKRPILSATEGLADSGDQEEAKSLEAERRIVEEFRQAIEPLADRVVAFDTLGEPVAASIAATSWSDGFIAHWGAGLAKYKWIVNAVGLVFTSDDARRKSDLLIYDLPSVREGAIPSDYIPQDIVHDNEDVKSEVMNGRAWTGNFEIDPDKFAQACLDWIAEKDLGLQIKPQRGFSLSRYLSGKRS